MQMNRPYPRTVSTFRRDLLATLRQIRDEGPVNRYAGITSNVKQMMCANKQESIWIHYLYSGYMRIVGNPYDLDTELWENPIMLQILHRMIRHMENSSFYLGTDL